MHTSDTLSENTQHTPTRQCSGVERSRDGRICDMVHFVIGSHVGQAFLPDSVT
jgi:hypothetical protein